MKKKNRICNLLSIMMVALLGVCYTSCGSDDDDVENSIDTSSVVLYVDDTKIVEGNISESESENAFVASIKNNTITANHIGQTTIIINKKNKIPVIVMPKYVIMTSEPILDWGITKNEVKTRWKLGTLSKEENDVLVYNNCGDAELVGYAFKNGKLSGVSIALPISKGTKFANYLTERFFIIPYEINDEFVGYDAYSLEDAKTTILFETSGQYKVGSTKVYTCTYLPASK